MSKFSKLGTPKVRHTKTIPATLKNLFQQVDFINGVKEDEKICFKSSSYTSKSNWWANFWRGNDGESAADLLSRIDNIQVQLFEQYNICSDEDFANLILTKLVDLRTTCIKLRDGSYSASSRTKDRIAFNTLITAIGIGLPEHIRESQGIPKIGVELYTATPFNKTKQKEETEDSPSEE